MKSKMAHHQGGLLERLQPLTDASEYPWQQCRKRILHDVKNLGAQTFDSYASDTSATSESPKNLAIKSMAM